MFLDALHERGLLNAATKYEDPLSCVFPLFSFVSPLSITGFHFLLGLLMITSIGITIGLFYRPCTIIFASIHWYLFFLDKRKWNNHSYLFATIAFVFCFLDANAAISVDSLIYRGCRRYCSCSNESNKNSKSLDVPHVPHVPAWQVWIIRVLHSMVYSIAGLKKLFDFDWTGGYAMSEMSMRPLFQVFCKPYIFLPILAVYRYFIGGVSPYAHANSSNSSMHELMKQFNGTSGAVAPWWFIELTEADEQLFDTSINHFIHKSGLMLDLFVGWMLFTPKLRTIALLSCVSFHLMTTQMFSIGLFPWVSLCLLTMWLNPNWTQRLQSSCSTTSKNGSEKIETTLTMDCLNSSCVANPNEISEQFPGLPETIKVCTTTRNTTTTTSVVGLKETNNVERDNTKDDNKKDNKKGNNKGNKKGNKKDNNKKDNNKKDEHRPNPPTCRHHISILLITVLIGFEIFLPYSHFITKGFNSWTQGLYGYSWDMMIHTWRTQHVRVAIKAPGRDEFFIRPTAFLNSHNQRNFKHPDMLKQYAQCVRNGLEHMGIPNASVYVDVWRSMNKRYQQRFVDPNMDLTTAPWSPYVDTPWLLPCLFDYDNQREELDEIAEKYAKEDKEVVFVADFPQMSLEHYVNGTETESTILLLMHGQIEIQFENGETYFVPKNQNVSLPLNQTHIIKTLGNEPSRYMYTYEGRSLEQEAEERLMENKTKWERLVKGWDQQNSTKQKTLQYLIEKSKSMSDKTSIYVQMSSYIRESREAFHFAFGLFNGSVYEIMEDGIEAFWKQEEGANNPTEEDRKKQAEEEKMKEMAKKEEEEEEKVKLDLFKEERMKKRKRNKQKKMKTKKKKKRRRRRKKEKKEL